MGQIPRKHEAVFSAAPHSTVVGWLDDVFAARKMILRWSQAEKNRVIERESPRMAGAIRVGDVNWRNG